MRFILIGFLMALFTCMPFEFDRRWYVRTALSVVLATVAYTVFGYWIAKPLVGPFGGIAILLPLLIGTASRLFFSFTQEHSLRWHIISVKGRLVLFGVVATAFVGTSIFGAPMLRNDEYRSMIGGRCQNRLAERHHSC